MPRTFTSSLGRLAKTACVCAAVFATLLGVSIAQAASGHDKASLNGPHASESSLVSRTPGTHELDISVVDLSAGADSKFDELELTRPTLSTEADSTAPKLFLAPRVATLVQDVFGEDEIDAASELVEETTDSLPNVSMAPLADSSEILSPGIDESGDVVDSEDRPYSSMRIYREMYRTDI